MTTDNAKWPGREKPASVKVKLVRDRIDENCYCRNDPEVNLRPCNTIDGKRMLLQAKLHEEASEIAEDPRDPAEYADLLEVLLELARVNGVPWQAIEHSLLEKRRQRGGFRRGMVMTRKLG